MRASRRVATSSAWRAKRSCSATWASDAAPACRVARQDFGAFAPTVFHEWGVRSNEDIGRIVFQLVESGQLSARAEDAMQDFVSAPDLLEAIATDATPLPAARPDGGELRPEP